MPNKDPHSLAEHEQFLNRFPVMQRLRLHGEVPACDRFVVQDYNPMSGNYKNREVYAPNEAMKRVHKLIIRSVSELHIPMPYATGGLPGCSPATNLSRHADNRFFALLDLKDAYGQVDMFVLAHILVGAGMEGDVRDVEDLLRTYCQTPSSRGLCTGMPSSPLLFNVYCAPLDDQLGDVCAGFGMTYSRYLDDLTFSSPETTAHDEGRIGRGKRQAIRDVIKSYGLIVNERKTKVLDLEKAPVRVNGLQLNRTGRWQVPTEILQGIHADVRAALHELTYTPYPLSDERWERLAGNYGILVAGLDKSRGMQTPRELETMALYRQLKLAQRIRRRRAKV